MMPRQQEEVPVGVNQEQAQRWNGESGQRWVEQRQRMAGVRENLLPHLWRAARIAPGDRVLDVGCGCGDSTIAAADAAQPGGWALGLDISRPMLAVARQSGSRFAEFVEGDAQVYPLPPAGFDVVISSFGVMFFDDPVAAFANLRGALRPDGRLAFLCWQPESRNELFGLSVRAFGAPLDEEPSPFSDPDHVTKVLVAAGFSGVRIEPVTGPARLGSDPDDVMAYERDSSRVKSLRTQFGDTGLAAMAAEYAARARPDGVWVTAAAWLVRAGNSHPG